MTDITIVALRALSEMADLDDVDRAVVWGAADEIERLRNAITAWADEIRSLRELGEKMAHIIATNCSDAPGAPVALTSWWLLLSEEERLQADE